MIQVGPLRGRPLRDVRARGFRSRHRFSSSALRLRSELSVPRAEARSTLHGLHYLESLQQVLFLHRVGTYLHFFFELGLNRSSGEKLE